MSIWDRPFEILAAKIASYMQDDMGKRYDYLGDMYNGDHPRPLKVKVGRRDDNVITNIIGVNVNRSVSRMLRGGVEFELPEGNSKQQEYLDTVWRLNKKDILLLRWGLYGSVFGTAYMKIVPDKLDDQKTSDNKLFPRLVPLYPEIVRIKTAADDKEDVIRYRIEWSSDTEEIVYREDTTRQDDGTWLVENFEKVGSAAWQLVSSVPWPYMFSPIIHNQNLPSLNSVYGVDEMSDAVNIQNEYNMTVSNTGKVIYHHGHPRTIFKGISKSQIEMLDDSPDSAIVVNAPDAEVHNLEMDSDLASSREFANDLKRNMTTVQRETDMSTIEKNLGDLTNFGLRVLYTDAIDKNGVKRMLYGEALEQINRALLTIDGFADPDPGEVKWGDALVTNIMEEITADNMALDMGIVDKQTVAERSIYANRYGVSWEDIQERLKEMQDENREEFGRTTEEGTAPEDNGRQGDNQGRLPVPVDTGSGRGEVQSNRRA